MEECTNNIESSLLSNTMLHSLTLCEIGSIGLNIKKLIFYNKLLHLNVINLSWKDESKKVTKNSNVLLQTKLPVVNGCVSSIITVNILWDGADNSKCDSLNLSGQCKGDAVLFIAFSLYNNKTVHMFDISDNNISDLGAQEIAKSLCENRTLHKLDISSNHIRNDGAKAISNLIKKNSILQELIIKGNNISIEGAKQITEAIKIYTTLQKLDISNNKISNSGATAISDCLKHNNSLRELNLSKNEITNEGVIELCEAIRINTVLLKLNISKNWITTEGIVDFLETINGKFVLQSLNVTHNNVTKCGLIKIEQCIKKLSFALEVYVSWNKIKDENYAILKSRICLLDKHHNHTIQSIDIEEDEFLLDNISNPEYKLAFVNVCLKEDDFLQRFALRKMIFCKGLICAVLSKVNLFPLLT